MIMIFIGIKLSDAALQGGGETKIAPSIGFLQLDSSLRSFFNNNPTAYNNYIQSLEVNNLDFAIKSLPPDDSVLQRAENWEIVNDQNGDPHLRFRTVSVGFDFQTPTSTNPGGNYVAALMWDPNLTGNSFYGLTFYRNNTATIYKGTFNGGSVNMQSIWTDTDNSGGAINAAIGDFNNDGRPDIFIVRTNEDNQAPTKARAAYVLVGGNNDSFSKTTLNIDNWNANGNAVVPKWTAGAVATTFLAFDNNTRRYTTAPFDYNGDGRQDIVIASADGCIYVLPNTSSDNNVSFGDPIKILNTGLATGRFDIRNNNRINYNGAQVISMGDINRDGIPDIVVGSTDSSDLYIYYGQRQENSNTISYGNGNNNNPSNPDVELFSTQRDNDNNNIVVRENAVSRMEYRGPNTQTNSSGDGPPFSEYTGAATNIALADINKDGQLDIMVATDNWHFRPQKYMADNGSVEDFDLRIRHTDINETVSAVGGRVYAFVNSSENNNTTFRGFFLGQYAVYRDNQGVMQADFDNATVVNFYGPNSFDFVATDGNHAQTLFTFLSNPGGVVDSDSFSLESKDLIRKFGGSFQTYDFNQGRYYIRSATIQITGDLKNIPLTIGLDNGNDFIQVPPITTGNRSTNPLVVTVVFYPQVGYKIDNGSFTKIPNQSPYRGSRLRYELTFDTSKISRQTITTLTGQQVTVIPLDQNIDITNISLEYEVGVKSARVKNWKEVR